MKYSTEKPFMYDVCHEHFGADWDSGTIFAVGDTIHAKYPDRVTKDVEVHEQVHMEQQAVMGVEVWWQLYLTDAKFRTNQEIRAYKAQLEYARKNYDRNYRKALEKHIYNSFSMLSGGTVTLPQAKELLQ